MGVAPTMLAPDAKAMQEQVEHLFGGYLGGCHEGLVELAWTDPVNHRLNKAQLYGTDRLDDLVTHAVALNSIPDCNVYIGAALRRPETPPFGRASDEDFFALTAAYVDLDEPGMATAAKDKYGTAKPTKVVVTGSMPHPRAQLWWLLDEPIVDPRLSEGLLKGMALKLDGDPTVVNPSRVMRLAGSIAWPVKPGRVVELTGLITPNPPLAANYDWAHLARLFPGPQPDPNTAGKSADPDPKSADPHNTPAGIVPGADGVTRKETLFGLPGEVVDGREAYMLKTLTACLIQLIAETGETPLPQALFDLAWPQFARKCGEGLHKPRANGQPWTAQAFAQKVTYTLKRFAEGKIQGCRNITEAKAIGAAKQAAYEAGGGQGKYHDHASDFGFQSKPGGHTGSGSNPGGYTQKPTGPLLLTAEQFVQGFTPPAYLIDGMLQRGYLYSMTARTGHGKTAVAMYMAQAVARGEAMHGRETKGGTVLLLAGENPDDIRARFLVLAETHGFKAESLKMRFIAGVVDLVGRMAEIEAEAATIEDLMMVIVDTQAAYFPGDETNSNSQQGAYARLLRRLTFLRGKPTVLVNCHPVKNASRDNLLPMGGSAFTNEVDGNLTLWNTGDKQISLHWLGKFRGPEFDPVSFELRTADSSRVVDAEGRLMPSVVAMPISELAVEAGEVTREDDENRLLRLMHSSPQASFATLASSMGFVADGKPQKYRVQRIIDRLKNDKLVENFRGRKYSLTRKGRRAIGVDGGQDDD